MSRDSPDYSHGDTGTKPTKSLNFKKNERPDAQRFDWFWYTVINALKGHASEFGRLDSDNDGVVDEADYANDADASTYKGNDIDSDGDSRVDAADHALDADHALQADNADTVGEEPPSNFSNEGHTHPRSDLTSRHYDKQEGGTVDSGTIVPLFTHSLDDGETIKIDEAMLTRDGFTEPCVSGVDLVLVPDGSSNTVILSGNGSTLYDREEGDPLESYTNNTGGPQTIMIGIDNGHYNSGYGSAVSAFGGYAARVM